MAKLRSCFSGKQIRGLLSSLVTLAGEKTFIIKKLVGAAYFGWLHVRGRTVRTYFRQAFPTNLGTLVHLEFLAPFIPTLGIALIAFSPPLFLPSCLFAIVATTPQPSTISTCHPLATRTSSSYTNKQPISPVAVGCELDAKLADCNIPASIVTRPKTVVLEEFL